MKDKFAHHPFAVRRKILEQIPADTIYCYIPLNFEGDILHIKTCPYWKSIGKQKAACTLFGYKDRYSQDLSLIWDQCKACHLRYPRNKD